MLSIDLSPTPLWPIVSALLSLLLIHKLHTILTHPLRPFPGPLLHSISDIPLAYSSHRGRKHFFIASLHATYGPVVRISPSELSFNTAQSWRDIYSFRPNHAPFTKSDFYDGGWFSGVGVKGIIATRDVGEHAGMRRHLSHAFSKGALREQEGIIGETVDVFVGKVREVGVQKGEVLDIADLVRNCTFDVVGELAFGGSFDAVKNGGQHPSIRFIRDATKQFALVEMINRFRYAGKLIMIFFFRRLLRILRATKTHENFVLETVKKRIQNPKERPDLLTRMIENYDHTSQHPIEIQIASHSADLMVAGSDTSSTVIITVLNYILRSSTLYDRVRTDIRTKFRTYEDIDAIGASNIPFLKLLILEAMRIYPPVPLGLPRLAPKGGDTVDGHYVPEGTLVGTNALATCLSSTNFPDPYEFRPERWDTKANSGQKGKDILEASQPFSMGARACLGQNLAWLEMNLILCKLIWSFDMELVNTDMDLHRDSKTDTLWDGPPLMVRVKERSDIGSN